MIHAAADARPDRVARSIYVDSVPLGEGGFVTDDYPPSVTACRCRRGTRSSPRTSIDLTDEVRASLPRPAVPEPYRVMTDRQHLHDARRYDVPSTVIACEFTTQQLRQWMDGGATFRRGVVADARRRARRPADRALAPVHASRRPRCGDRRGGLTRHRLIAAEKILANRAGSAAGRRHSGFDCLAACTAPIRFSITGRSCALLRPSASSSAWAGPSVAPDRMRCSVPM